MKKLRAAIIGTGGFANAHVSALHLLPERVEVAAAVDDDAARARAFCGEYDVPRAYNRVAAMLTEEAPDLVIIAAPPAAHCDLALQSLRAGAHVLCEKPLCSSLAELDCIAAAEKTSGKTCSGVLPWRFGSGSQHVKQLTQARALGKPLVGICQTTWYRSPQFYEVPPRGRWDVELGGPTMGHGIHAMDLFLWLMGDWREVRAMIGTLDRRIEVEDVSMALVRFENGAMGSIINSVLSPRQESYLRFDFQKVTVEATGLYGLSNKDWHFSLPKGEEDDRLELAQWQTMPPDVATSHAAQIEALLDSIERGERPLASGTEARRVLEFSSALYKAAATGLPVRRGTIGPADPFYRHVAGTLALDDAAA